MCMNCIGNAEFMVANGAIAAGVAAGPLRRWAARAGLVQASRAARDRRTAEFLRGLDLEPAEVLGAGAIDAVDVVDVVAAAPESDVPEVQPFDDGTRAGRRSPTLVATR